MRRLRTLVLILLGLFIVGTAVVGSLVVSDDYRSRIYPGVSIGDEGGGELASGTVDVGGLTREAARDRLAATVVPPDLRQITVQVGAKTWQLAWSTAGQSYDFDTAIDHAMSIGRDRLWWLGVLRVLNPRPTVLPLPVIPADTSLIRAFAEKVAEQVATTSENASLVITAGKPVATPAQEGLWLDTDTATAEILEALAQNAETVALILNSTAPEVTTAEPGFDHATMLLAQSLVLVVDDPLTGDPEQGGYSAEFSAAPQEVGSWIRPVRRGSQIDLNYDVLAVRDWVQAISPQLGEERTLAVDATTARILESLRAGSASRIQALIQHPPSTYVVQSGDTFYDIAYNHGFPQWQLEKANPDVDPGLIDVGQELTIPSLDVLFPHPLVPGKRIEVDLPTQTLRAYDQEALLFEFEVSTGISTTPTLAGQFQILFKEDMAFAQRWHLDMPYFMGFYEEGEDFFNGFHELPITSYGARLSPYVLGWPASYGCIILDVDDAVALYDWADIGTHVRVNGVAPGTPFGQETLLDIAPLVDAPAP